MRSCLNRPYAQHAQERPVRLDLSAYAIIAAVVMFAAAAGVTLLTGLSS